MSVELLDQAADDIEIVLIAWLSPLRRTAIERRTNDPLPFTLVKHVTGGENVETGFVDDVVSVKTLCDRNLGGPGAGWTPALREAKRTHRRMLELAAFLGDVRLAGGRLATIDYVRVFERAGFQPYGDDQILQSIDRYQIGLSYVPAD